jgi:hypothetical protein
MAGIALRSRVVDDAISRRAAPETERRGGRSTTGKLVAVCGLCGGAGASTLAYLLALWSLEHRSSSRVLVIDAGSTTGGLSLYVGASSARSLSELAGDLDAGAVIGSTIARSSEGLRVLATGPRSESTSSDLALGRVVNDARQAHSLTVADCGIARSHAEQLVLQLADSVIWVFPASESGLARARLGLESTPEISGVEVFVARHDASARKIPTRRLAGLAATRGAPLVLMPGISLRPGSAADPELRDCAATLEAISAVARL